MLIIIFIPRLGLDNITMTNKMLQLIAAEDYLLSCDVEEIMRTEV
jgi:hypothetical protein